MKVVGYFCLAHLGSQKLKHLIDGNSQPSDTRFASTFIWLNRNVISIIHK